MACRCVGRNCVPLHGDADYVYACVGSRADELFGLLGGGRTG